jgi:flagellar L-ring protein precursor FlgH
MGIDGSARQLGDHVTVLLNEESFTSLDANTNTSRESSTEAAIAALLGAEKTLVDAHPNMDGGIGLGMSSGASYAGGGTTTRGSALQGVLTCSVVEVFANGNLRVWGQKEIRVNRETQYLTITGVVRPRDIQMDNTVSSQLLAEGQLHVSGSGVVADRGSGPGWGSRIVDFLWPF